MRLARDGEVTVTAAPQIDHSLKSLKPRLATSLAARVDQRRLQGARGSSAFRASPISPRASICNRWTFPLQSLGEIAHRVIPVRDSTWADEPAHDWLENFISISSKRSSGFLLMAVPAS
jgi:hypothetical protein